jgi:hypothetical protein
MGRPASAFCCCPNAGCLLTPFLLYAKRDTCIENDRCLTATSVGTLPFVISASNSLASIAGYNSPATTCNRVDGQAKAVWYDFVGDGSCVSASVVGEGFDAILALYEGDECGSITCVDQINIDPFGRGLLSWRSGNGTAYKILVAGANGRQSGDYVLGITVRNVFLYTALDLSCTTAHTLSFCVC